MYVIVVADVNGHQEPTLAESSETADRLVREILTEWLDTGGHRDDADEIRALLARGHVEDARQAWNARALDQTLDCYEVTPLP